MVCVSFTLFMEIMWGVILKGLTIRQKRSAAGTIRTGGAAGLCVLNRHRIVHTHNIQRHWRNSCQGKRSLHA